MANGGGVGEEDSYAGRRAVSNEENQPFRTAILISSSSLLVWQDTYNVRVRRFGNLLQQTRITEGSSENPGTRAETIRVREARPAFANIWDYKGKAEL
ncbi:hypothetical protein M422DRAFT_249066 [Sphaerobolus stellatus SS14]|nr:hypothetical protein M422DRAFT_249066 [Sphaerobolus stellatus SS14]